MMMVVMMMMLNSWPVGRADSDQGRDVPTQAGALHGTVQALVQSVTISLQHLCCIFAIFVHNFCNIMCNISPICLQYFLSRCSFYFLIPQYWKRGTLFLKVYFPSPLCTVSLLLCETLFNFVGTVANGQCPPSNLLIHTSRFQVFDDLV